MTRWALLLVAGPGILASSAATMAAEPVSLPAVHSAVKALATGPVAQIVAAPRGAPGAASAVGGRTMAEAQRRIFPLLAALAADPAVAEELRALPALAALRESHLAALRQASVQCSGCAGMTRFTPADIDAAAAALSGVYDRAPALRRAVRAAGEAQGVAGADAAWLGAEWRRAAAGINAIIDVYGTGAEKRPDYDGPVYDLAAPAFARYLSAAAAVVAERAEEGPFFAPSLGYAAALLAVHGRDEAGRHAPLADGENKAALKALRRIRWTDHPYGVILVPGEGIGQEVALSPASRLRAELAAIRYRKGLAPLILLTGGYVHPNQTRFSEALEMKRLLVGEFGIPESAILVDPHARHTTTNVRNAARLMLQAGIPGDRKGLLVTSQWHSAYVAAPGFAERCLAELGYLPAAIGKRLSPVDLEFLPLRASLAVDPRDPLDP